MSLNHKLHKFKKILGKINETLPERTVRARVRSLFGVCLFVSRKMAGINCFVFA